MLNDTNAHLGLPAGLVVLISGVPGVGKTTISYELLRSFDEFRIIEETDLIREALRGYSCYIQSKFGEKASSLLQECEIHDHMKFLTFADARRQCQIMKSSFEEIITRQQRKGISTIINGVHIVPEVLSAITRSRNTCFINLFISNEAELNKRLKNRNPEKYTTKNIELAFQTNLDLYVSTKRVAEDSEYLFNNINVSSLTVRETLAAVEECIRKRVSILG